ncbi:19386_t:CDS:2 [Entrophospora sp. SA101]|nr:4516_t:CDS:2 [Entrophospora sp. SA101]CAJ0635837.1 3807_t:CDS:2 [Entrophospora sp. SA101]CAJ0761355.1 19386_t:CDS:2 [Entrophospora sp. SA101]CAJ0836919.1 13513_t:CDS:2 [Entrophospora sp. SA101]CAJ0885293.1 5643_t:CDS:2 [Entrophospora sp. SA101]
MPYSGAKTGFRNAPITKALLLCVSGCSLAAYLLDRKSLFQLQLNPQITTNHELWRLLTSNIALTTSGEFFFGSIAIYQLRIIEQQFVGALFFGRSYGLTHIPPGPYGFIFAALYQYMKMIPSVHKYKLLGLPFGKKTIVYFMGALPLLAFRYPHSIIGGVCGILADHRLQPTTSSSSSTNDIIRRQARIGSPSVAQTIVNEEHIANLRAMFPQSSQEVITQALETTNNDINRAAQFLLDHHF